MAMTNEQALQRAQRLHLDGRMAEAEAAYRDLLGEDAQGHAARHWLGFLLLQQERLDEAREALQAAVAGDGGHAEWHFNLGLACARLGRVSESIAAWRAAAALDPACYVYWTHLGAQLARDGHDAEAERTLRHAIALDPSCPEAFYLLTDLLLRQQRFDEARRSNAQGVLAEPPGKMEPIAVAQALCALQRLDEARALAQDWLSRHPSDPVAAHLLAAFGGGDAPEACAAGYVSHAFDAAAAGFDQALARLEYRGPQWVADCLAGQGLAERALRALDLGCGTGLVGEVLRPYALRLEGVDLSGGMLARARGKQLYDALRQADILADLRGGRDDWQLIACMDTLPYFGRLDALFEALGRALQAGGLLLFCTERLEDETADYRLHHSGRYRHAPAYLDVLLSQGWRVLARDRLPVRDEAGCPVAGEFVCAERRPGSQAQASGKFLPQQQEQAGESGV
ncbi:tetratricopeptide repeat protein [Chromobacterium paludis]|uniref:Tetratricopeptide repeat protein n=1 Tax=Chromobacterium paludis TaxID=2605945 RepID=A0A5C1DCQ6_9NEIS|nr:tetratricopeptide repeat protein [Chromobacterium paludis]QEL54471.1 tetratricopeptide repeat protein [Chromobacterium paludis]